MAEKKNHKVAKTLLSIVGLGVGTGLVVSVVKEVKKEYDNTVEENNRLRKFIDEHDFYKKNTEPAKPTFQNYKKTEVKSTEQKFAFTKVKRQPTSSHKRPDGTIENIYVDPKTGLSLIEVVDDEEETKAEQA